MPKSYSAATPFNYQYRTTVSNVRTITVDGGVTLATPINYTTPQASTYLELRSARYDSSFDLNATFSVSALATPVVTAKQMVFSSATGKFIINVGTTATPVLRSIATS